MRITENGYHEVPAGKVAAVVTCLEMRRPPSRSPKEPPAGLRLVRRHRPDPGWYRTLFREIGARWLWFSRLALAEEELRAILEDPAVEIHTVEGEEGTIGLLELDRRHFPDIELAFLGLLPRHTGRGIGRWLLDEAIARAFARRPRRFWVHTCTFDHPAALSFYMAGGFRPYARFVEIADDPRLAGLLPDDAAPHVPVIGRPDGLPFPAAHRSRRKAPLSACFWKLPGRGSTGRSPRGSRADFPPVARGARRRDRRAGKGSRAKCPRHSGVRRWPPWRPRPRPPPATHGSGRRVP